MPPTPSMPLDPLTEAVYEQSDNGLTPVEIAQQLDEQIGKVELILALREPHAGVAGAERSVPQ